MERNHHLLKRKMYFLIYHGLKSIIPAGAGAEDGVGEAEGPADGTELGLLLGEDPPPPEEDGVGEAEGPADGTELGLLLGEEPPPPEMKKVFCDLPWIYVIS